MQQLLMRFGLPALFLGAALEGDVSMILAGVAAHLGLLDPVAAFLVGAAGAVISDLGWFWFGRWRGAYIRGHALYLRAGPAIERFADRIGLLQIPLARFVYGTRIATMIFWGSRGLRLWRFILADLPGCILWSGLLGGLGFLASDSAATVLGRVKHVEVWLLYALILAALVFALFHGIGRRRLARLRAKEAGTDGPGSGGGRM